MIEEPGIDPRRGVERVDVATEPERLALIYLRPDGEVRNYSFAQLSRASNRFANALVEHGVRRGDRVAVLLPQVPETQGEAMDCPGTR